MDEIGIHLYDPKKKEKKPLNYKQKDLAKDVFFLEDLLLEKRNPNVKDTELPFYLKRKGVDLWEIKKNTVTSAW